MFIRIQTESNTYTHDFHTFYVFCSLCSLNISHTLQRHAYISIYLYWYIYSQNRYMFVYLYHVQSHIKSYILCRIRIQTNKQHNIHTVYTRIRSQPTTHKSNFVLHIIIQPWGGSINLVTHNRMYKGSLCKLCFCMYNKSAFRIEIILSYHRYAARIEFINVRGV